MIEIIWHSLRRRRVQSAATVTSVAVSVAILFCLFHLYAGASLGLDAGSRRLGADLLVVPASAVIEPETLLFTGAPANIYMPREIEGRIANVTGVRRTSPQFFAQTLNETCCSLSGATRLIGFDPTTDWTVQAWGAPLDGRTLGADEIVVGAGVEGVAGKKAYMLGRTLNVVTVLQSTGTSLDYSVLMPIDAVRVLSRTIPYLQVFIGKGNDPSDLISAVLVETDPAADKDAVATAVEKVGDLRVVKAADVLATIRQQLTVVFCIMLGGGILAALASFVQLFGRFFTLAWDRRGEWGLYRALGATRGDLKRLILGEAAILIGAGVALGLLVGEALGVLVRAWLMQQRAFPFIPASGSATAVAGLMIAVGFGLIALAAVWWPARQSGAIAPSSAMAMGDIDRDFGMLLQAVNVSHSYGREEILAGISVDVTPGGSVVITGPSGCGKSTLISLLGLLLEPTSGDIILNGRPTAKMSDEERSRLRNRTFGFVFQHPQLIGTLSVMQNVLVPARLSRQRGLERRAEELLCGVGLAHRMEHLPHQLSIGQKRRVAIARALLLDPPIVIADEPTNDLDSHRAGQIGDLLFGLTAQGRALVMVTHDERQVARADRSLDLTNQSAQHPPL